MVGVMWEPQSDCANPLSKTFLAENLVYYYGTARDYPVTNFRSRQLNLFVSNVFRSHNHRTI